MAPLVSIVIPTFNRRQFLPGALDSVLAQTTPSWELWIVDDGSQDDTAAAIAPYLRDPRVHYVAQSQQGRSAARNRGIALAQGEWVAFLDSDDRYRPGALAAHLATANAHPDLALAVGGYEYVDEHGRQLGERRPWTECGLALSDWLFNCLAMPGSVMIARAWLQRIGGFDPECEIAEDWDLFLRLALAGGAQAWTQALVCQYRQHTGQSVLALTQHHQGSLRALEKLFNQPHLPPEVGAQRDRAVAWVHVLFARRAFWNGRPGLAQDFLAQAAARDPQLTTNRKTELLEYLLVPAPGQDSPPAELADLLRRYRPHSLAVSATDLRRAQARVAVSAVWSWSGRTAEPEAWPAVRRAYWRGVSRDPRWLGNRGLWSILWRAWAGRA